MQKWFSSLLIILLAFGGVITSNGYFSPSIAPEVNTQLETKPAPAWVENWQKTIENIENLNIAQAQEAPITGPKINSKRLLEDVKNLVGERYEEVDRLKTIDYIIQQLKQAGWQPQERLFADGINIFAERSGTDTEAGAILIAAHYDTVLNSPGADDNATGIATVLEVARLLRSLPTPRTLQIAFFDQEEKGLRGSLAYTAIAENLKNLRGAIILDMLGFTCHKPGCQTYPPGLPITPPTNTGNFIAAIGDIEHWPMLATFRRSSNADLPPILTLPIPLKGIVAPDTLRSDHAPFWYKGIGAVLVTDTANLRTPHYHQHTDTINNIDRKFFIGSAQIVVNATKGLLESKNNLEQKPKSEE